MIKAILFVGAGGLVGSVLRYLIQLFISKTFITSFPWPTFAVNIIGSFIIGILYALADEGALLSPEMRLLLATGFCGGFTTFSSFAFDNLSLLNDGHIGYSLLYIMGSVVLGVFAAYIGVWVIKYY